MVKVNWEKNCLNLIRDFFFENYHFREFFFSRLCPVPVLINDDKTLEKTDFETVKEINADFSDLDLEHLLEKN